MAGGSAPCGAIGLRARATGILGVQMRARTHRKLQIVKGFAVAPAAIASAVALAACGSTNTVSTAGTTGAAAAGSSTRAPSTSSSTQPASSGSSSAQPSATTGSPPPSSSPAAGPSTSLKLAADSDGELGYNTKQLTAKAGRVTITMTNMSPIEHNVTLARGATVLGATPTFQGGSKSLTLNLKPGTYSFYCSVPGHRAAGMEGTLTVTQ
jgi:plastocyanin